MSPGLRKVHPGFSLLLCPSEGLPGEMLEVWGAVGTPQHSGAPQSLAAAWPRQHPHRRPSQETLLGAVEGNAAPLHGSTGS